MNSVLVLLSFDTKIKGCVTTMSIDNHSLTHRRLQFIGICVNKLTFKSININFNCQTATSLLADLSAGTRT